MNPYIDIKYIDRTDEIEEAFEPKIQEMLSAYFNGKIAYANIPFKVIQRSINSKQSKFIKMKYTDMNSFVETK